MSRRPTVARRQSRRVALQVLYALDLAASARSQPAPGIDEVFERVSSNFDLQEGARVFAKELVCGVAGCRGAMDARIASHSRHWRVERMAAVDRNVLRLAAYELIHTDTPDSVVLNEAIELARDFGTERSPAFVNGVLDAIARELREQGADRCTGRAPGEGALPEDAT
ncbi:MAG TPA: transcription antitermination factor NusB [Myxococcota bacterium]